MIAHEISTSDARFRDDFEACRYALEAFDHRAHVRLAYVYLAELDDEAAVGRMRDALLAFLDHHGVEASKYHETLTRAWIFAVRHFIERGAGAQSADDFIEANPTLLDSRVMLSHYSTELLFSDEARTRFVEPDLTAIPRHPA